MQFLSSWGMRVRSSPSAPVMESQPLRSAAWFAKPMAPTGVGIVFSAFRHINEEWAEWHRTCLESSLTFYSVCRFKSCLFGHGEMAEWLIALVSKTSILSGIVGLNPTFTAKINGELAESVLLQKSWKLPCLSNEHRGLKSHTLLQFKCR